MGPVLSVAASVAILRSTINQFIPDELRSYATCLVRRYSSDHTFVINESHDDSHNSLFNAAKLCLGGDPLFSAASEGPRRFLVGKSENSRDLVYCLDSGSEVVDVFDGVPTKWKYIAKQNKELRRDECLFELRFHKKHLEMVRSHYLHHVLEKAKVIKDRNKVIRLHTLRRNRWTSNPMSIDHPMTFDTLALDKDVKDSLLRDLTDFINGRDYYRKIGKAWKRGYLLYGPPGTGKSSLIAAMANSLNYDIYLLNLSTVSSDSDVQYLLLHMSNRSILVIEDIDCSVKTQNRESPDKPDSSANNKLTLSGLLNAIDGLLSSCGDERIIVFTTNYKDRIDPALLRPGRMDMHVPLSYCTFSAFEQLCQNYLGISNEEALFGRIKELIGRAKVTPAEVAGELMKSRDPTASLEGLVEFLGKKAAVVGDHHPDEKDVYPDSGTALSTAIESPAEEDEILKLQEGDIRTAPILCGERFV